MNPSNLHRPRVMKAFNSDPVFLDADLGLFVGNVSVGTPPQSFTVGFDTGSADFWLVNSNCTDTDCNGQPQSGYTKHKFNAKASSTFVNIGKNVSIEYVTGIAAGVLANDTVYFGKAIDKQQSFGVMTQLNADLGYMPADGLFGLAYPPVSAFNVVPPFQNVMQSLASPVFTIWLDKHPTPSATYNGLITFGGVDGKNCKADWTYVDQIVDSGSKTNQFWQYTIDSFTVGGQNFTNQGQSIVDSGTSWLNAPSNIVDAVATATNAEYQFVDDIYVVDCDTKNLPDLIFEIGGKNYAITPQQYLLNLGSNNQCAIEVYATPFQSTWLVGDTMIRAYCHAFDVGNNKIGLATSIHS
jgi:hypothetical protein